ncbi:hypothetical protein, partial [Streptococcus pneumoniae]|uniref:hypothetical protein n=1 Tax=Streptococcus pneumoniae TaxID=1313 RepID=UPI001E58F520
SITFMGIISMLNCYLIISEYAVKRLYGLCMIVGHLQDTRLILIVWNVSQREFVTIHLRKMIIPSRS